MISFPAGDRQTPMHMHTVKTTPYDILRREVSSAIWLETSPDLVTAKSRIKEIASFWPGRFEVIDRQSQRIVAAVATPSTLHAPLKYMRECLRKSLWMSYDWLLAPAPRIAGLAAYTRLQKYVRGCYRTSCEWLFAPVARVR
jgi:hypothetical protein